MTPVNNKSLLAHIFGQMTKLDKKEIDVKEAREQANLAKQANNVMRYELQRADTIMKLAKFKIKENINIELREVESKNF